ncbi:MAG: HupE/UreJ family protein [Candidatus Gracilibacteria bacterium]
MYIKLLLIFSFFLLPIAVYAHGVSTNDATFMVANSGPAIIQYMYLGAKHMITGYDHILFLIGVVFFLYHMKDIALYVSLFTIGHSTTLLIGVLGGITVNSFLIDAIIGLSVVYKGFDNLGGFKKVFGFQPSTKKAVGIFGLFHGFGLAAKLQDYTFSEEGLITNIISFNVGVEIGQILALILVLVGFSYLRIDPKFQKKSYIINGILMLLGFILIGFQLTGYFLS